MLHPLIYYTVLTRRNVCIRAIEKARHKEIRPYASLNTYIVKGTKSAITLTDGAHPYGSAA